MASVGRSKVVGMAVCLALLAAPVAWAVPGATASPAAPPVPAVPEAMAPVPATGLRIAVVDLHKLLNESRLRQEINQNMEKEAEKKTEEFNAMGKEIDRLKAVIEHYQEASPERLEKEKDLLLKLGRADALEKWEKKALNDRLNAAYLKVYGAVTAAVGKYAKEKGFDLVLRYDKQPIAGESRGEILNQIFSRGVLYFAPQVDITDGVMKEINQ